MYRRVAARALAIVVYAPSVVVVAHAMRCASTTTHDRVHGADGGTAAAAAAATSTACNVQQDGAVRAATAHTRNGGDSDAGAMHAGRGRDSAAGGTEGSHLPAVDEVDAWVDATNNEAVAHGERSVEAAAYYKRLVQSSPEVRAGVLHVLRVMGNTTPQHMSHYQQKQLSEALSASISSRICKNVQDEQKRANAMRNYMANGTATGENNWYEAGDVLMSPEVPGYVRDDILHGMQADRKVRDDTTSSSQR